MARYWQRWQPARYMWGMHGFASSAAASARTTRKGSEITESDIARLDGESEDGVVGTKLIPLVNKLQEVLSVMGTELDLPQLVVLGGQSSGKSSVIETLVGRDFLPRGMGIVTRRPLILQLNQVDEEEDWGEFHYSQKRYYDFSEVRREIEVETDRVTGKNKGISAEPIILKIFSKNVLPLTLVDTPGMTRVPVGDQSPDIEHQIRDMVMTYARPSNAIMLAVHPANQDLATSDALQFARAVDPAGDRTVGVLTKLDLMDAGTNAMDMLTGKTVPLKLGYVPVINRSQMDIVKEKSISSAREAERRFFASHPQYKIISSRCGSQYLAHKCNRLLTEHIRKVLPSVKSDIRNRLRRNQEELLELGEAPSGGKGDMRYMLLQILNKFCSDFKGAIHGQKGTISTEELHGGARLRYIFDEVFRKQLGAIKPNQGLTLEQYRTAIRNAAGPRPALFVPDGAFEMLVKQQIALLRDPAMQCADLVMAELQNIGAKLDYKDLNRFVLLRDRVMEVMARVLRDAAVPTRQMIANLIQCELSYINTNHPDFIGGVHGSLLRDGIKDHGARVAAQQRSGGGASSARRAGSGEAGGRAEQKTSFFGKLFGGGGGGGGGGAGSSGTEAAGSGRGSGVSAARKVPDTFMLSSDLTERERMQIGLVQELLDSYFEIARRNLQDSVTKAIWHFMVERTVAELQKELFSELYESPSSGGYKIEQLLMESESVQERRNLLQAEQEALSKANSILQVSEIRQDFY